MTATSSYDFRVNLAKNMIADMKANNYYVAIGKADAWSDTATDFTDDAEYPEIVDGASRSQAYQTQIRQNLLAIKKTENTRVAHGIRRYNWQSGQSYIAWDSNDPTIFNKVFYVVTDEAKIYKCLRSGAGASTVKPTHTSVIPQSLADGYLWKYMVSRRVQDVENFISPSHMVTRTIILEDGQEVEDLSPEDQFQYGNQQDSKLDKGRIYNIKVSAGGSGYTTVPTVTVEGDGTGCTATAVLTGGAVSSITVNTFGTNYKVAKVTITGGGGTGAKAYAVMAPGEGHGTDPVKELFGNYVLIGYDLIGNEEGTFMVNNDYRQISLMKNPTVYASETLFAAAVGNGIRKYDLSGLTGGNNILDSLIVGQTSGAKAFVVTLDAVEGIIGIKQNDKTGYRAFQNNEIINAYHDATTNVVATATIIDLAEVLPDFDIYSGDLILTDNKYPISRSTISQEKLTLVLQF